MPDPETSPPSQTADSTDAYPNGAAAATHSLARLLAARIANAGPLPFLEFMDAALYHPQWGYYARGAGRIGREGDFFTSVSVGPVFGTLLARRLWHAYQQAGCPQRWRVVECGAHDGRLAADVLSELQCLAPRAYTSLEYLISEPLPSLRTAQQQTLHAHRTQVAWTPDLRQWTGQRLPGLAFGNELLDALPFEVVEWRDGQWWQCRVGQHDDGSFVWQPAPVAHPGLAAALAKLPGPFSQGYRTEIRAGFGECLASLLRCLDQPLMIWLDYGFARADYYQPDRHSGTLRTFNRHRAGEDPLAAPGGSDITAHVDFTAVAEAAIELGGVVTDFRSQGTWLTHWGREWLLALEGHPNARQAIRQFQTLTHPAHLGASFQVIELSWRPDATAIPSRLLW